MKYLLVGIVLYVAWRVWRSRRLRRYQAMVQHMRDMAAQIQHMQAQAGQWQQMGQPPAAAAITTIACAHCGLHVPQAEAIAHAGQWFCCTAHAHAARP